MALLFIEEVLQALRLLLEKGVLHCLLCSYSEAGRLLDHLRQQVVGLLVVLKVFLHLVVVVPVLPEHLLPVGSQVEGFLGDHHVEHNSHGKHV